MNPTDILVTEDQVIQNIVYHLNVDRPAGTPAATPPSLVRTILNYYATEIITQVHNGRAVQTRLGTFALVSRATRSYHVPNGQHTLPLPGRPNIRLLQGSDQVRRWIRKQPT